MPIAASKNRSDFYKYVNRGLHSQADVMPDVLVSNNVSATTTIDKANLLNHTFSTNFSATPLLQENYSPTAPSPGWSVPDLNLSMSNVRKALLNVKSSYI